MRRTLHILACVWLVGCTSADEVVDPSPTASGQPDVRQIASTYRSMRAMTPEPVYVDPGLAMLCRGATHAEVEAARAVSGPHAHAAISIFMNDAAADAFGGPSATFPVGSIIVKEKTPLGYRFDPDSPDMTAATDGVGGMVKRSPGYDPANGDWEYFYFEDPDTIERGRMNSCIQCHRGAAGTDYVFGQWASGG